MVKEYPYLAYNFKGRIKSIIRAEEKFNRYIVDYTYEYYKTYNHFPKIPEIKEKLSCFRNLIAYRIVISVPKCHVKEGNKRQEQQRSRRSEIPEGVSPYFDEAFERVIFLEQLDLSTIDVNMFAAVDNKLINDGCGLFRGRQILPFEHLSRFQNGLID